MKKFKTFPFLLLCIGISCSQVVNRDSKLNKEQIVASPTVAPIIGLDESALDLPYIREFVEYYFYSRCSVKPILSDVPMALRNRGPKIILCTKDRAKHLGVKLPDIEIQNDGFHLISTYDKQDDLVIYCVGNNVNGIKYATYRLIHELSYKQTSLSLTHPIELSITPFFENRIATPGLGLIQGDDPEANSKFFYDQWNEEKVLDIARLFDFFGFNGLEVGFCSGEGSIIDTTKMIKTQLKLVDEQRRIGGKGLARIRASVFMTRNNNICLNTEEGRQIIVKAYQNTANGIANHFDAFITHWADPGGSEACNCPISYPLLYHVELMKAMKKYNPKIESFFSLWNYHPTITSVSQERRWWSHMWHWTETNGIEDFLELGILPDSVGIWVGDPNGFNPDYFRAIVNKGRTLGNWSWYLADNEVRQGLHVHWKQVAEYLQNQSEEDYGKFIKWQHLEAIRHGDWNSISMAVGGAMMIDPHDKPEKYAREFCASIVGFKNADILLDVLDAIAQTRCLWHRNLGELRFLGHEGWGSNDPEEDINRIQNALENLDKVTLEKNFIPKIPYMELIFDPEVMLSDLRKNLQFILLHNKGRSRLIAEIESEEFRVLSGANKQEAIINFSKELAPIFDLKGIGTCPEAQIWDQLKNGGRIPELPHQLSKIELHPELSN